MKNKPRKPVLVVEDEVLLSKAIEKKLGLDGWEVVGVRKGQQALDYLKSTDELPQIIWLDYYLPDMTGLDFVVKLKEDKRLAEIPVMVVSNSASEPKVKSMLALGVKKYLLKADYRLSELIKIMEKIIGDAK